MTSREQLAAENEMSIEYVNWFLDNKKDGCGNVWFMMMAAMWEGWKERDKTLEESQREFRAADATIHNLELKLTDMAVQLAKAESKCRELASELSAVDKIHNEAVFITDDHYEQCPPEVQKIIRSLAVLQIPAYQAFLAEVRAQGVEMFAMCIAHRVNYSEVDKSIKLDALSFADGLRNPAPELSPEDVVELAAQLRKGAAL